MIKKILLFFILTVFSFSFIELSYSATREAFNEDIKTVLLNVSSDNIAEGTSDDGLEATSEVAIWIKNSLTNIIVLIAIGVFLFIGIRLAFARGNPEEFKKGMMQMIYAVVGIFVVSIAWAAVKLVSGINF